MMKHFILKITAFLLVIPVIFFSMTSCEKESGVYTGKPVSRQEFLLDTLCTITLYSSADTAIINGAMAEIKRYENLFSVTIPTSEVSKINQAKGQPVEVSEDTLALLNTSIHYSELSGGLFDVTCGLLTSAWHFSDNRGVVPPEHVIQKGIKTVNYRHIVIDGNTVRLLNPETHLDFGAIAKGYIADRISEYLKGKGITGAVINLGGNVLTVGQKPGGRPWNVGIQQPFKDRDVWIGTVKIGEKSVGTSGIYERAFEKDGRLYHHLLDLKTGYPADNTLTSVTIISEKSVDGEGLSTSCFLMPMEQAIAWIESIPDTEAIFITKDNEMHVTSGIGNVVPFSRR